MEPEEWPVLFTRHLNAGDLESVVALYEPGAYFVTPAGEVVVGREQIREELDLLVRFQTKLESQVVQTIVVDNIAMLYTDFDGTTTDPSGRRIQVRFKAIEVLRRQSNGTWRLMMGDPVGRTR